MVIELNYYFKRVFFFDGFCIQILGNGTDIVGKMLMAAVRKCVDSQFPGRLMGNLYQEMVSCS